MDKIEILNKLEFNLKRIKSLDLILNTLTEDSFKLERDLRFIPDKKVKESERLKALYSECKTKKERDNKVRLDLIQFNNITIEKKNNKGEIDLKINQLERDRNRLEIEIKILERKFDMK